MLQVLNDISHGWALRYRAGVIPSLAECLLFLPSELFDARGHGLPQKELLKNVALWSGEVSFRVKRLSGFGGKDHSLNVRVQPKHE